MRRCSSRGLTLLEMVVVLVILVALAGVAIQSAQGLVDGGRYEASRRSLTGLDNGTIGRDSVRHADGTPLVEGFVADIGRLPAVVLDSSGDPSLDELLTKPAGLASYGLKSAPSVSYSDATYGSFSVESGGFSVAAGWRGPYLRLRVGASSLLDGWGSKFDLLDAAGAVLAATDVGTEIAAIRSNGADKAVGSATSSPYDGDIELVWKRPSTSVDRVSATIAGSVKISTSGVLSDPTTGDLVIVLLFGPDPATGGVLVTSPLGSSTAPTLKDGDLITSSPWSYSYATTSGQRVIRAYVRRGGTLYSGTATRLVLSPGGLTRDLIVSIP